MDRITPTGWGKTGGREVERLGSLRAVMEALKDTGGVIIIGTLAQAHEGADIRRELDIPMDRFAFMAAAAGPDELHRIHPETPVGVAPNAFASVPVAMWADMQKIISKRFTKVVWA